jgi:hypothetical protein
MKYATVLDRAAVGSALGAVPTCITAFLAGCLVGFASLYGWLRLADSNPTADWVGRAVAAGDSIVRRLESFHTQLGRLPIDLDELASRDGLPLPVDAPGQIWSRWKYARLSATTFEVAIGAPATMVRRDMLVFRNTMSCPVEWIRQSSDIRAFGGWLYLTDIKGSGGPPSMDALRLLELEEE